MRTLTSAVLRPPFTRATERARIVVADGPDRGAALVLAEGQPLVVGTAGDAALVLSDPAVSRHHLEVRWERGMLAVVDRTSKNGTFAGGVRIHEAAVPPGTELRVGETSLHLVLDAESLEPAESASSTRGSLVGSSRVMRQLFTLIDQIATTAVPVLIDGETGTGKRAVAREIHTRSRRSTLGELDCADPERELDQAFADADGGTLLLDDVGALAPAHQLALLRILDHKVVRPTGNRVDVRVIAIARSGDLHAGLLAGTFRDDLFYRLAVIQIALPPLRDRRDDIPALAQHFAGGRAIDVAALAARDWPGNVRELRNTIEAAIASDGALVAPGASSPLAPRAFLGRSFRDAKADMVEAFERRYLEELMARSSSLHAAAEAAEMDRKHLRTLLRRHGLRDR